MDAIDWQSVTSKFWNLKDLQGFTVTNCKVQKGKYNGNGVNWIYFLRILHHSVAELCLFEYTKNKTNINVK